MHPSMRVPACVKKCEHDTLIPTESFGFLGRLSCLRPDAPTRDVAAAALGPVWAQFVLEAKAWIHATEFLHQVSSK